MTIPQFWATAYMEAQTQKTADLRSLARPLSNAWRKVRSVDSTDALRQVIGMTTEAPSALRSAAASAISDAHHHAVQRVSGWPKLLQPFGYAGHAAAKASRSLSGHVADATDAVMDAGRRAVLEGQLRDSHKAQLKWIADVRPDIRKGQARLAKLPEHTEQAKDLAAEIDNLKTMHDTWVRRARKSAPFTGHRAPSPLFYDTGDTLRYGRG
jgi:hypothetical protein